MTGSTGESGIFISGTLRFFQDIEMKKPHRNTETKQEGGSKNLSYLPSLLNEGLLGLVRLLKNSSNWKA